MVRRQRLRASTCLLFGLLAAMGSAMAQLPNAAAGEQAKWAQEKRVKGEWLLPAHYPDGFDGIGKIDRVGDGEIVIDDRLYKLSTGLKCGTFKRRSATLQNFHAGQTVGFLKNAGGKILSLWSLERSELEGFHPPRRSPAAAVTPPRAAP